MNLKGRQISEVRDMEPGELDDYGWGRGIGDRPMVIILDDGTKLVPSRDEEGNGPGALFIEDSEGNQSSLSWA